MASARSCLVTFAVSLMSACLIASTMDFTQKLCAVKIFAISSTKVSSVMVDLMLTGLARWLGWHRGRCRSLPPARLCP